MREFIGSCLGSILVADLLALLFLLVLTGALVLGILFGFARLAAALWRATVLPVLSRLGKREVPDQSSAHQPPRIENPGNPVKLTVGLKSVRVLPIMGGCSRSCDIGPAALGSRPAVDSPALPISHR